MPSPQFPFAETGNIDTISRQSHADFPLTSSRRSAIIHNAFGRASRSQVQAIFSDSPRLNRSLSSDPIWPRICSKTGGYWMDIEIDSPSGNCNQTREDHL